MSAEHPCRGATPLCASKKEKNMAGKEVFQQEKKEKFSTRIKEAGKGLLFGAFIIAGALWFIHELAELKFKGEI